MSINIYVLYTSVSLLQSHSVISLYHNWWNIPRNCSFVKDNSLSWQSGWYHLPLRGVEKINGLNILQIRILYGITMIDWYYKQLLLNIIVLIIICHKNIYKILDKRDMWSYQYQGIHVHVGSFVCVCVCVLRPRMGTMWLVQSPWVTARCLGIWPYVQPTLASHARGVRGWLRLRRMSPSDRYKCTQPLWLSLNFAVTKQRAWLWEG